MTQPYSPPNFPPPARAGQPGLVPAPVPRARGSRVLAGTALVVALAAAAMSCVALGRHFAPTGAPPVTSSTAAASVQAPPVPDPRAVAAAKSEACTAWSAASRAMVAARQPFADKTQGQSWEWTDPAVVGALTAAQAGMSVQIEYMRQHLPPETPADVANAEREFIAASIDVIAADGQHSPGAVANAAAARANAAKDKIQAACGTS